MIAAGERVEEELHARLVEQIERHELEPLRIERHHVAGRERGRDRAADARPGAQSSFASTPPTTGSPGPWSVGSSVVAPRRSLVGIWVWNDMSGITSAAVALPPRKP